MSSAAIHVENLEKSFPPALSGWRSFLQPLARATQPALAGVSFDVKAGEAVALVGPNGAGKSTLLRILATLLIPSAGRAALAGCDVERDASGARRQLGYYTGGDDGFYGRLTARQNLAFFAAMNNQIGEDAAREIGLISEWIGIAGALDRQVRTFSTGMIHRLGLARALLHRPAVLLLDEPTRSLDPIAAEEFRQFLKNDLVRERGTALLFASHTLSEVEEIAGRVVALDAGRVVAFDSPAGIVRSTGATSFQDAIGRLLHAGRVEKGQP
ncbi:MAG: ABC transporter ATP-binding protein [Candidatus Acidiferrales bacterium]